MKEDHKNLAIIVILMFIAGILIGLIISQPTTKPSNELELIDAEPGVRCAVAHGANAVAINCWEIEE